MRRHASAPMAGTVAIAVLAVVASGCGDDEDDADAAAEDARAIDAYIIDAAPRAAVLVACNEANGIVRHTAEVTDPVMGYVPTGNATIPVGYAVKWANRRRRRALDHVRPRRSDASARRTVRLRRLHRARHVHLRALRRARAVPLPLLRSPGQRGAGGDHGSAGRDARAARGAILRGMRPGLRKLVLTTHVTISVGWLGAVVAYLALAITAVASGSPELERAAFLSMEVLGWYVIVSLAIGALLTGVVQSITTPWGLFRHHWVLTKFILTSVATIILVKHMPTVNRVVDQFRASTDPGMVRIHLLVHAAAGLAVLIAITAISIYKPWGRTAYGRRKQREDDPGQA